MIKSMIRSEITDNRWYDSMNAGNAPYSDYQLIATAFGTGSSGTITFSSIPQDYKHLQIRYSAKNLGSGATSPHMDVRFNNFSSFNVYHVHRLYAINTALTSDYAVSTNRFRFENVVSTSTTVDAFQIGVIDIGDYSNPNTYKTLKLFSGRADTSNVISSQSGLYERLEAIDRVDLILPSGDSFNSKSRFSLYGIRG